jgi:hypothetical protein
MTEARTVSRPKEKPPEGGLSIAMDGSALLAAALTFALAFFGCHVDTSFRLDLS